MEKRALKLCWKRRGRGWTAGSGPECGLHSLPVLLAQSSTVAATDEAVAVLEWRGRGTGGLSPSLYCGLSAWFSGVSAPYCVASPVC